MARTTPSFFRRIGLAFSVLFNIFVCGVMLAVFALQVALFLVR